MILYETEDIRSIVLLGHGASGKTSLVESMLFKAVATARLGSVENGISVSDYDPDAKRGKALDKPSHSALQLERV
ncbi:MAG: hypothetical protein HRU72_07260 [Planctomycetia bacterium]|nr:hypothetical protein [Candidatus Brocadia sp.]QOJ06358.1 MAG: hypothetical protein HRU72_07260 [Planctomycetia bacterium]HQU31815.1 hypothetical protein [Candidatus Brocadia sapporoensis]